MPRIIEANLPALVFMKVGQHAGEEFQDILERKRREFETAGCIFWGYGGGTMHPIQKVQPFARLIESRGSELRFVMQPIDSRHPVSDVYATEFSSDGVKWEPLPKGVVVRGSRYALVLGEIVPGDLELNLSKYRVGIGPAAGRPASEYVRGRVDKACLEIAQDHGGTVASAESGVVRVRHMSGLRNPYGVLLR